MVHLEGKLIVSGCKEWYDCWNIYYVWRRSIVLLRSGWRMDEKGRIELIICYKARWEGDQSFY